ncbi:MAG: phosphodiesterase, partial [Phyllobacterium sp.]
MIIAQISDFHARPAGIRAYAGLDTTAFMQAAVDALCALDPRPDCVLVTGDLTDCGLKEEYEAVATALSHLPMPDFVIPGNHDRRDVMRESLRHSHPYLMQHPTYLHYVIDDFPVRLIGLDTIMAGEHGGEICAEREDWLAARLGEGQPRPTLVFMHHPPFRTGVPAMDLMMCRSSPSFARMIEDHPEIERIATGHYHRSIVVRWAGTIGFVAPGTAHQVALDLRENEPTRLVHEPPAFALHVHRPGIGIASHVVP